MRDPIFRLNRHCFLAAAQSHARRGCIEEVERGGEAQDGDVVVDKARFVKA